MSRFSAVLAGTCLFLSAGAAAQDPEPSAPAPTVREIRITGTHDIAVDAVRDAARVTAGEPLPIPADRVDDLAARVVRYYRDEGYTFARVTATFSDGILTFAVDEG